MTRSAASLVSGLLFGAGLAISGMTHPQKVIGFLDITGRWDPSLLFVLGGAVGVTLIAFRFVLRRSLPILDDHFHIGRETRIDAPLLFGSAIFGVGWGITGYCPGPAIALAAAPNRELLVFLPALLIGSAAQMALRSRRHRAITPLDATSEEKPVPSCG
jgi:hypothetical protein